MNDGCLSSHRVDTGGEYVQQTYRCFDWRGLTGQKLHGWQFNYDIAWIHFFQHNASNDDIYRDCMANWIFT